MVLSRPKAWLNSETRAVFLLKHQLYLETPEASTNNLLRVMKNLCCTPWYLGTLELFSIKQNSCYNDWVVLLCTHLHQPGFIWWDPEVVKCARRHVTWNMEHLAGWLRHLRMKRLLGGWLAVLSGAVGEWLRPGHVLGGWLCNYSIETNLSISTSTFASV